MDLSTERLIEEHLSFAQSLAQKVWRTAPHALDLEELRAIANLGLVGAATRWLPYCAEKGYNPEALEFFKPFVKMRVNGALIDAIRASDWATRSLRTRARQIQEAEQGEPLGYGKTLTPQQLADRTGLTVAEVRATVRGMAQRPVSLEAEELDPASTRDVESSAFTQHILSRVVAVLRGLAPDEQTVVALHYYRGLQLQEVAKAMGITESRASQLHARAVLTVHEAMVATAQQTDRVDAA